ncbi:MAG: RDD family protein [Elusimicrobia bacterium]|nr:RDD family protein [Elusimicrobiota bacterium]
MTDSELASPNEKNALASFGERLLAVIADNFLVVLIPAAILIAVYIGITSATLAQIKAGQSPGYKYFILIDVIYFMSVPAFYYALFWSKSGMTPGKRLAGVKVVRLNGERLTYPRALARAYSMLLYRIPVFQVPLLIVSAVMIGFEKNKRALHDMIAETIVVKNNVFGGAQPGAQADRATGRPGGLP